MRTFTLRFFPNTRSLSDFPLEVKHTSSSLLSSLIALHLHEVYGRSFGSFATSGHPCTKLNWRLADTRTIGRVHSLALICRSCSLGIEVEPQENCSVSESDCNFSRGGLGFNHNVGTSVSCMGGVDLDHCGKSEGRPGQCQILLGLMSVATNVILLGLRHMRPFQWWLKSRSLHPLWNPLRLHTALLGRPSSHVTRKLAGDEGCVSNSKTLLPRPEGLPCVGVDGKLFSNLLHRLLGQVVFNSPWVQLTSLTLKCGSRHPIEVGAGAQWMATALVWWSWYGRGMAGQKWTCLPQRSQPTIYSFAGVDRLPQTQYFEAVGLAPEGH